MTINIEIAYATEKQQDILKITIPINSKIVDAIKFSNILEKHPEIDITNLAVGVFGKRIYEIENYVIKNNDRIEIYRPLLKSPNQKRLERAKNK